LNYTTKKLNSNNFFYITQPSIPFLSYFERTAHQLRAGDSWRISCKNGNFEGTK